MVPMTVTYRGDLRCEAQHGPSGQRVTTDAPKDNQGRGEAFSPTDLLCTALATCCTTIMGIVARRDGISLDGLRVDIEKHMSAAPPRRVACVVLRFAMPAGIAADRRKALQAAVRTCPVALSIHPEVVIEESFAYPD
jgi:putative redox protein